MKSEHFFENAIEYHGSVVSSRKKVRWKTMEEYRREIGRKKDSGSCVHFESVQSSWSQDPVAAGNHYFRGRLQRVEFRRYTRKHTRDGSLETENSNSSSKFQKYERMSRIYTIYNLYNFNWEIFQCLTEIGKTR